MTDERSDFKKKILLFNSTNSSSDEAFLKCKSRTVSAIGLSAPRPKESTEFRNVVNLPATNDRSPAVATEDRATDCQKTTPSTPEDAKKKRSNERTFARLNLFLLILFAVLVALAAILRSDGITVANSGSNEFTEPTKDGSANLDEVDFLEPNADATECRIKPANWYFLKHDNFADVYCDSARKSEIYETALQVRAKKHPKINCSFSIKFKESGFFVDDDFLDGAFDVDFKKWLLRHNRQKTSNVILSFLLKKSDATEKGKKITDFTDANFEVTTNATDRLQVQANGKPDLQVVRTEWKKNSALENRVMEICKRRRTSKYCSTSFLKSFELGFAPLKGAFLGIVQEIKEDPGEKNISTKICRKNPIYDHPKSNLYVLTTLERTEEKTSFSGGYKLIVKNNDAFETLSESKNGPSIKQSQKSDSTQTKNENYWKLLFLANQWFDSNENI